MQLNNLNTQNMTRIAGITLERTSTGRARFAHIDLRKHSDFIPFLEKKGLDVEPPIKWTAKMQRAFKEKEFTKGDINNFWAE